MKGHRLLADKVKTEELQVQEHQRFTRLLTVMGIEKWMMNQVSGKLHRMSVRVA